MTRTNDSTHQPETGAPCCPACAAADDVTARATPEASAALAAACTLGADDFAARLVAIRDLTQRSLLRGERAGMTLHLVYESTALAEVEDLIARETECCAFLDFSVQPGAGGVRVTVTAPESSAAAAEELYARFLPDPAGVARASEGVRDG